ncbi:hypothetical protein HZA75_07240 [Candidatus Roizmanbacteria bacterium]|nr:hypothetical protein [Candidatus Roizmanbacteria bacterium]
MKRTIRFINDLFIKTTLFVFYFIFLGLIAIFYRLARQNKKNNSFWNGVEDKQPDVNYFKSPY